MATIDILCVIDTNGLMASGPNPGTQTGPTSLGSYNTSDTYIFMICDGQYVANGQAQSELTVNASVGDTIRWTITDPSTGLPVTNPDKSAPSYSCIFYNCTESATNTGSITPPAVNSQQAVLYYNPQNAYNPQSAYSAVVGTYMCSAWTSTVLTAGTVQYSWWFQVIDCHSGDVAGYFFWDPFINISAPSV